MTRIRWDRVLILTVGLWLGFAVIPHGVKARVKWEAEEVL